MMRNTHRAIERVREGMMVLDPNGREVGRVEYVGLGDPEAEAVESDALPDVFRSVAEAANDRAGEPQLPEPVRTNFRRIGFLKVDGPGLMDTDHYVRADWIADVNGDGVVLTHAWEKLPREI
jgi:hypothetical protein